MRCLSIANALKDAGWHCAFLTIEESADIVPALGDFDVHAADYIPESADFLVVDHYSLDKTYESAARSWVKTIMVIDDLANRSHDCDVLLDQTMGREEADYKDLVPSGCQLVCGGEYIILRPQFLNHIDEAKQKRADTEKVKNILVSFGSTNPDEIIQTVVERLCQFDGWPLTIDVVASSGAQGMNDMKEQALHLTQNTPHSVEVNLDVDNMADFMTAADLSFGGGGTTSWERACLGLPTILIEVSDDQAMVSKNLHEFGAVERIGDLGSVSGDDIDKAFEKMRDNGDLLRQMSEKAFRVCDGQGVKRLCKIIQTTTQDQAA